MSLICTLGKESAKMADDIAGHLPTESRIIKSSYFFNNPDAIDWMMYETSTGIWIMVGGWAEAAIYRSAYSFAWAWQRWNKAVDIWINTGPDTIAAVKVSCLHPASWATYILELQKVRGQYWNE